MLSLKLFTDARRAPRAFTLIELLVSMAVLALLIAAVVAMVSAVSRTTVSSRRRLDADNEARRVLDSIGNDFVRMFKRADADNLFAPGSTTDLAQGANGKFFFYSDAPAYYDAAAAANPSINPRATAGLIGYRINTAAATTNTSRWQLERLGKGLTWDGAANAASSTSPGAVVFLTYPPVVPPAATPPPDPNSTLPINWSMTVGSSGNKYDDGVDVDYQVISPAVFRIEYCFLLKTTTAPYYSYSRTHTQSKGFKDVAAIVVAIALLDTDARRLLPTAGAATPDLTKLIQALPEPNLAANPPQLMAELWNKEIRGGTFAADTGMPNAVVEQVRVYQRFFYLNTPN